MKLLKGALINILAILFYSCSDQIISPMPENSNTHDLSKLVGSDDTNRIYGTNEFPCGYKDLTVWLFDHYEPQSNKIVGIWPNGQRMSSSENILTLKNKFGFNYLLFANSYNTEKFNLVLESGFDRNHIMVQIVPDNYIQKISTYGICYSYFVDEPVERNYELDMGDLRNTINNYAPDSKIGISGYRRTYALDAYVSNADIVMFSSYQHWWECLPGVWCSWPVDTEQRPDWSDMKERYLGKSSMNWVGAHKDLTEYPGLLGHSHNLQLPGIWLYQLGDIWNDESNILSFCYSAWAEGYLRRFDRKYVYEYRCTLPNPCDCDPDLSEGWHLENIWQFNEVREVIYQP